MIFSSVISSSVISSLGPSLSAPTHRWDSMRRARESGPVTSADEPVVANASSELEAGTFTNTLSTCRPLPTMSPPVATKVLSPRFRVISSML